MTEEKKTEDLKPSNIKREVEVNENNPWGDDVLERQKFAKPLTDLVNSAGDAPFCIAVDGEWGGGKTFFLKRWRAEFSKQGNKAIYFNAWEDDFYADPLTAIIGQLQKEIESPALEEICNMCDSILKKTLIELLGKVIKGDKFEEKDLRTAVGGTVNEYAQTRNTIEGLKQRLKKLAKDVRGEETKPPLVFIVDELDRCRPTFAIELLERVKHIVGVPGIVFVFGINQKELAKSIQSVYGDIDTVDYLRKFFDVGMTLPQAEASKYCLHLIRKHKIAKAIAESPVHNAQYGHRGWESDWHEIVTTIPTMLDYMGLSLRQTEQAIRMWLVVLHSKEVAEQQAMYKYEGTLAFLILLRIKNRDMYDKFFNESCELQEVMNYLLDFLPWKEIHDDDYKKRQNCMVNIVLACYFFCTEKEYPEIINEFRQASKTEQGGELPQKYRYVPQKIVEIQHDDTRRKSISRLFGLVEYANRSMRLSDTPSRQKVARFLEWGDNWRI